MLFTTCRQWELQQEVTWHTLNKWLHFTKKLKSMGQCVHYVRLCAFVFLLMADFLSDLDGAFILGVHVWFCILLHGVKMVWQLRRASKASVGKKKRAKATCQGSQHISPQTANINNRDGKGNLFSTPHLSHFVMLAIVSRSEKGKKGNYFLNIWNFSQSEYSHTVLSPSVQRKWYQQLHVLISTAESVPFISKIFSQSMLNQSQSWKNSFKHKSGSLQLWETTKLNISSHWVCYLAS